MIYSSASVLAPFTILTYLSHVSVAVTGFSYNVTACSRKIGISYLKTKLFFEEHIVIVCFKLHMSVLHP